MVYVNSDGTLYARGEGEATVTCTATDSSGNTLTATCEVSCSANKPVYDVELAVHELEMEVGDTFELGEGLVIKPDDANNKTVTYKSSDTNVVIVRQNGKLEAVSAGEVTITVTTADGGYTDTCVVTVTGSAAVPGDLSGDGIVGIDDTQAIFALALDGEVPEGFDASCADVSGDGEVDLIDVQMALNLALAE